MKYNFEYITKYIMEYDTGVPNTVILGVLTIVCGMIILLSLVTNNTKTFIKNAAWCLLLGYLFLTLGATVLFREATETMRYSFCPFLSYTQLYEKSLAQIILNVGMFIPIGYLLGVAKNKTNTLKILKIGCLLSLTIEIVQLLSKRGVFNIDDVIHNTIGGIIGYGFYRLASMMIRKNFPV